MKIKKTRYIANFYKDGQTVSYPLYDRFGNGTSGEGVAFGNARKLAKEVGLQGLPFAVEKVTITADVDTKKAIEAGCCTEFVIDQCY